MRNRGNSRLWATFGLLLVVLLLPCPAAAQFENLRYVFMFSGDTQGEKIAAAQASCTYGSTVNCVLILSPLMNTLALGTIPARPVNVTWVDYRQIGGVALNDLALPLRLVNVTPAPLFLFEDQGGASGRQSINGNGVLRFCSTGFLGGGCTGAQVRIVSSGSTLTFTPDNNPGSIDALVLAIAGQTLVLPVNLNTSGALNVHLFQNADPDYQITIPTATHRGFLVRGAAAQSANLFEARNSANTLLAFFDSGGDFIINNATNIGMTIGAGGMGSAQFNVTSFNTGTATAVFNAITSGQTTSILVARTAGGTTFFDVTGPGSAGAGSIIFGKGLSADAGGFKHLRTTAGCATAASVGAVCDVTVTWTTAFADANYTPQCNGFGVTSGVPASGAIVSKVAASLVFRTIAITAVAAQFTNIYCTAVHD